MAEDSSSIDRLRKKLYSRTGEGLGERKRRTLRELTHTVNTNWTADTEKQPQKHKKDRALGIILILSALFFVASIGFSVVFFFVDRNAVSSKNIDIEIQGPANIGGGEELVLQLVVTNNNPTDIQNVDLLIEYPEGTRMSSDISKELSRTREALNTIKSNEHVQKTARAVFFGEEGSTKVIKVTIEYRIDGSNAIFYREQTYEVTLSSAPITLSVDSVKDISSGQEIEFTVTVNSNSEKDIDNVLLVAEYPFGFEFVGATPKPFAKNTVWKLGNLKPEEHRTIKIRGNVVGENGEDRVFRFLSGTQSKEDETRLETVFITSLQSVQVERPFIGVDLAVNGDSSSDPVIKRSDRARIDISWFNNLPDNIFDGEIEVRVNGSIIDERSIAPQQGFYRSSDSTVLWTRETLPRLSELADGDSGTVSFSFVPISPSLGESFRTPSITLAVTVRGKRVRENNVPETVESTLTRTIKLDTDVQLSPCASYTSGPLPPAVGSEMVYTITWTAQNSTNPVGDVTVSAMLPLYMRWVGAVNPSNESVDFNEVGGQIRWNISALPAHAQRS